MITIAFTFCYFYGLKVSTSIKLSFFSFDIPSDADFKKFSVFVCLACFTYFAIALYRDYSNRPRPQNDQDKPYINTGWINDDSSRKKASEIKEKNFASALYFISLDLSFMIVALFAPIHFIYSEII